MDLIKLKMIISLGNKPSTVHKYILDIRFLFKKQSGNYSFIKQGQILKQKIIKN